MVKQTRLPAMPEWSSTTPPFRRHILLAAVVSSLALGIAAWLFLEGILFHGEPGRPDDRIVVATPSQDPERTTPETRPTLTLPRNTRAKLTASLRQHRPESMTLEEVLRNLSRIPSMPPGEETDARELALVVRWAAFNPLKACEYAYEASLDGADEGLLREAVSAWARTDPSSASRWASALRSPMLRDLAISAVYGVWTQSDREAAIVSLRSLQGAASRSSAVSGLARGSDRKPKEALGWTASLSAPLREKTLQQAFGSWLRRDPQAAAEWLARQPAEIQLPLAPRLAAEWARKDPQSALYWCRIGTTGKLTGPQLPPGPVQRRAMDAALASFVGSDPEAAAAWMMTPTGRPFFAPRVSSIASSWASMDPVAAAGWASSLSSGRERETAVGAVSSTWTRSDPAEALRWIQGIRRSSDRNASLNAFSITLAASDPEAAAYWGSQITERALREETISRVVSQWRGIDPGAASQFVRTSGAAAFLRRKP